MSLSILLLEVTPVAVSVTSTSTSYIPRSDALSKEDVNATVPSDIGRPVISVRVLTGYESSFSRYTFTTIVLAPE